MASSNKAVVEALSGGVGSLIALVATYPLKTIYTLKAIRAVKEEARRASREGGPQEAAELQAVSGCPLAALCALCRRRLAEADVAALYAGIVPAAAETVASTVVYFYLYSLLKQGAVSLQRRRGGGDGIGVGASLLVAALAGAGNMLVTTPAQVVSTMMMANAKVRQQAEREGRPTDHIRCDTLGVCREIADKDGPTGFWRGLLPSLILVVNPAVQYALFEWGMQRAQGAKARRTARAAPQRAVRVSSKPPQLSAGEVFLIGSLAKIGATIVTYPMIVVKSRLQATNDHTRDENRYGGTLDAVRRIHREEGAAGFYAGLRDKILQTALNAGLMLTLKDRIGASSERLLRAVAAGRDGGGGAGAGLAGAVGAPLAARAVEVTAITIVAR